MKSITTILAILVISQFCIAQDFSELKGFEYLGKISLPEGLSANPGQVSKNGKSLYVSLKDSNSDYQLYKYTRKKPGTLFSNSNKIIVTHPSETLKPSQPTTSSNEKIMVITSNDGSGWEGNNLYECKRKNKNKDPYEVKALSGINTEKAEAYPWISGDGLRLYFTSDDVLVMASRKNVSENFTNSKPLEYLSEFTRDILSCWLNQDESEIYFVSNNIIYYAKSEGRPGVFGEVNIFTGEFEEMDFIAGLSFTNDMKEMFLYYSDSEDGTQILQFKVLK